MPSCDIFCTVIDNFGDIGTSWRLARQLAAEHGWQIRLWVDKLQTFSHLCPSIDPQARKQQVDDIIVEQWSTDRDIETPIEVADIVIEAFACNPPPAYIAAMADRAAHQHAPVWINLEYLSSEPWVADFHLKPSPHPAYPLLKTFFFPGLTAGTGGVLQERALLASQQAFVADPNARTRYCTALGIPPAAAQGTLVSLFCYANANLETLLSAWRESATPLTCIAPDGLISSAIAHFLGIPALTVGTVATRGNLTVCAVPFVEQSRYDPLLWACDINFVRGEDSFVRAQWAQKPLVWQLYPQHDNAHYVKLDAALAAYALGLPADARLALTHFWHNWNTPSPSPIALDWDDFWQHRNTLAQHAMVWAQSLAKLGDLASNLAQFCESQLK
ncbi:elongation factor P maturation arginine rhamnosyltransferase EarP [Mycoavidus sp. B2-EB]|uniref:elongation factor P maturation arginine rhamnosyltransferase EarP n=1 Tax=Mycoavidus sp. B2-EB TaxID=2651972 RepID=UPI0016234F65|nr:elongation factor P maturation arginine rhamnosyltransferase EarP [Mycoavidus sp. B2-EB]BBO59399.1 hypothetical protein MPB2EB_0515 [Mycoavidus sp. B2-EB]